MERLRATFRWKVDGLDAAGLNTRLGVSSLTLGGLLKHLAAVEEEVFTVKLRGEAMGASWEAMGFDGSNDWEFASAAGDSPDRLYELWDSAVERSRRTLGEAIPNRGLDQEAAVSWPDGWVGEDPPSERRTRTTLR